MAVLVKMPNRVRAIYLCGRGQRHRRDCALCAFSGLQNTSAGEREVRKALRKTLFKYKLHQDAELFDKAYGYIRQYY